jgi:hypothetical protein
MIASLFTTNIVEVLSESIDPENQSGKIVLKVLEEKLWIRMMQDLLRAANPVDGSFGLEAHKVFHLGTDGVQYTWILVVWGDPADVLPLLAPILSRKVAQPPAFALGRAAPAGRPSAAAPAAPPPRAPTRPAHPVEDEDAPLPEVRLVLKDGVHNIKNVENVENGVTQTRTTIKLAHIRGDRFVRNQNPHESITLDSGRGRFKAVVQGLNNETGFSYRREGGGGSL